MNSSQFITDATVIKILVWLVVTVGTALLGLITFIGKRLLIKLDSLDEKIKESTDPIVETLEKLEEDLRSGYASLDRRLLKLEISGQDRRNDANPF